MNKELKAKYQREFHEVDTKWGIAVRSQYDALIEQGFDEEFAREMLLVMHSGFASAAFRSNSSR